MDEIYRKVMVVLFIVVLRTGLTEGVEVGVNITSEFLFEGSNAIDNVLARFVVLFGEILVDSGGFYFVF